MKVQRITETSLEINFKSLREEFSLYRNSFLRSEIGQIYTAVPWDELVRHFKLKEHRRGPSRTFSPRGMLALMFLKAYVDCSDRKLIEHLNGNINFQMFCDIFLQGQRLENFKIVSQVRTYLAERLDIREAQKILARYWKPFMEQPNIMLTDATCYESSVRYPTNVKLLWESVDWCESQLKLMCKYLKTRMPRNKYLKQKNRYGSYSRKRKKSVKERTVLTRSLLHLLEKILLQMEDIWQQYAHRMNLPHRYYHRVGIIGKVLEQQQEMFRAGESIPDRIVSINKSYIRPIVRGKEVKTVEFGAKVNMIQFDGINFIEHLSFNAFHEGIRLKESVRYGRELVGRISHLSGDDIYATNANRTWCKEQGIVHGFKPKGRSGKHAGQQKVLNAQLRKQRATVMEGSFGTEKEYYGLTKIKARTQKNEELCVFFGVHTANAVRIAKRMAQADQQKSAA